MVRSSRLFLFASICCSLAAGCNFAKDPILLFGDTSPMPDGIAGEDLLPPGEDTLPGEDTVTPEDTVAPEDTLAPEDTPPPQDTAQDLPPLPEWCCWDDLHCDEGFVCQGMILGDEPGGCEPAPGPGKCFDDSHCDPDEHCEGAGTCPCMYDCYWVGPGTCVPDMDWCCKDDSDCPETDSGIDLICVGGDIGAGGVCLPAPPLGNCYDDGDCPGASECGGQSVCSCDMNCISEPGWCTSPGYTCCDDNAPCPPNSKCVDIPGMTKGTCLEIPFPGSCWDGSDCAPAEYCFGQNPCPCDTPPDMDGCGWPGECLPLGDACCQSDGQCPAGLVCAPGNTCEPAPGPGKCFTDDDCYETQSCTGGTVCPCGMLCSVGTNPGTCTPLPAGCCNTDADCNPGAVCRGQQAFDDMPGSCVPDPNGPQCLGDAACCWSEDDCPGNDTCVGASVCGCIELCYNCGACQPDVMGYCMWY